MNKKTVGWGLVIGGGLLQVAEGLAHADAALNNLTYDETAIGSLVGGVENYLPVSLGWSMVIVGASILWDIQHVPYRTKWVHFATL